MGFSCELVGRGWYNIVVFCLQGFCVLCCVCLGLLFWVVLGMFRFGCTFGVLSFSLRLCLYWVYGALGVDGVLGYCV